MIVSAACGPESALLSPSELDPAQESATVESIQAAAYGAGGADIGRYYQLKSASSGLCADVSGNATADDAPVVQWGCSAGENQRWYFRVVAGTNSYQLGARHSDKCLRVAGGSSADGAKSVQDACARSGGDLDGTVFVATAIGSNVQLKVASTGKCLRSPSATAGAQLEQVPCGTTTAFQWQLVLSPYVAQSDANGRWSALKVAPLVPAAAATLANGKVLFWSSWKAYRFSGSGALDQTVTAVYTPGSDSFVSRTVTNTTHNMFCPGTVQLDDGRIFVNGGDDRTTATTSIYNYATDAWVRGPSMASRRWYNTSTLNWNGDVITLGGNLTSGDDGTAELWSPTDPGRWRRLTGLGMGPIITGVAINRSEEHPRLQLAPDGRMIVTGPTPNMTWYDVTGNRTSSAGTRTGDEFSQNDVTVIFDKGKIFKAGGNPNYDRTGALQSPSSRRSYVIDVNGGPTVTRLPPMKYPRTYANGVVLPTGQVVVMGGVDHAKGFSDDGAVLAPELFDPATNTFRELPPMQKPRPYHSVALLLPDARVLVGGGGLCSSSDDCAVNHKDIEIYSPPYLFGTTRPTISAAPATITPNGAAIDVTTTGPVTRFTMVRLSSVTHSINTDQRLVRLNAAANGTNAWRLTLAESHRVAPPGYYMLFALNGNTPSVARMIRVPRP